MKRRTDAFAKINLALDITGVRTDGYHNLRTVIQSLSLCDSIEISDSDRIEISCSRSEVPVGSENTVVRAAEAFFARAGLKDAGARFVIHKRIPCRAGLGGGSADAAAALIMLNRRFQTGFSSRELQAIGLTVGADVPFCVEGGTALALGVGEDLRLVPPMPDCAVVVCKPAVGIGTKEAYASYDSFSRSATDYADRTLAALQSGNLRRIGAALGNVFEDSSALQAVAEIKTAMLSGGAPGACMTGSGSAVFGLFEDEAAASACKDCLLQKYPETFLCRPVGRRDAQG